MKKPCPKCGALQDDNAPFCNQCKTAMNSSNNTNDPIAKSIHIANLAGKAFSNTVTASALTGEFVLGQSVSFDENDILTGINPFKLLFAEIIKIGKGFISSFKDKRKLIPAIVFSVIWVVLYLLPRLGINPLPIQILSFLTFAEGGISNSPFRMLGGLVGKGLYAYLITSLVMSVIRGENPFKSIAGGIKSATEQYRKAALNITPLLTGAGIALIFYNFMAGYASPWKGMAAITAMLLTLRSVGNRSGFLIKLLNSILNKAKTSADKKIDVKNIIAGMSAGFALSIPISAIPYVYICYVSGGAMVIASVILLIIKSTKKEGKST